jgi:hypothetical protein
MKTSRLLLTGILLTLGLGAQADQGAGSPAVTSKLDVLTVLQQAPCKSGGDGTYTEIVTTMASVLPPAEGRALLERYCDACNKQKFGLVQANAR